MDEAVLPKEAVLPEKIDDWQEIQNYIKAINFAQQELKTLPISLRLICKIHEMILSGVRGEYKNPFPILIKIAIFHYQLETLHPFCDGNGRMGRLLIPLMLISKNIISKPALYISSFFEKNKGNYYDSLTVVRNSNNIKQWVKIFLTGIIETSQNGQKILKNIITYKEKIDTSILQLGHKATSAKELIRYMFAKPILNIDMVREQLNCSFCKASALIKDLINLNIIKERTNVAKNRYYELNNYLDIFK